MRKTPKKEYRLRSAKNWIKTYPGKNIAKGYSKKYAVDKLCAVRELRILGVEISEEYENQLRKSMESLRQQRLSFKRKHEKERNALHEFESDHNFAIIMGYTSGGFPYGITHEEMEELKKEE